jgi:hypothetical protein
VANTVISMAERGDFPGEGQQTIDEIVELLGRRIAETDPTDPAVFQVHMRLAMALAGNQTAFAEEHGYQPGTVSRWVNGSKAPPPKRRGPVLRDAFAHLQQAAAALAVAEPVTAIEAVPTPRRRGRPSRR